MGRPIRKKWFTAREGSNAPGNLQVTTTSGAEPIIKQVGTGVYEVASGRVRLIDGAPSVAPAPGVVGDAQLQLDGTNVSKITQYRMYFFDGSSQEWRDKDNPINAIGTFTPPLLAEGVQATATAVLLADAVDSITVDNGGAGYTSAPSVTISGDGTGATATAVLTGDVVTSITVDNGGSGYTTATVTVGAP
jgi:hypothetical protein